MLLGKIFKLVRDHFYKLVGIASVFFVILFSVISISAYDKIQLTNQVNDYVLIDNSDTKPYIFGSKDTDYISQPNVFSKMSVLKEIQLIHDHNSMLDFMNKKMQKMHFYVEPSMVQNFANAQFMNDVIFQLVRIMYVHNMENPVN